MSEVKRYDAVHLRYEENNIRYGEGCEVEVVAAYDFDTLAQRLQEAERLLGESAAELDDWRQSFPDANSHDTDVLTEQIDAFLAGKQ